MSVRPESQTPSLIEVMETVIEDRLYELNTCMPAKVISVDADTGLLSVEPAFHRVYHTAPDDPVALPPIEGVPLANLRAGGAIISMPVKVGDFVTLWFSQRSLEKWKDAGKSGPPGDSRLHHISDAIAYPGGYPISENIKTKDKALQIKFGATMITMLENETLDMEVSKAKIHMNKDGKFQIGNGSVNLLVLVKNTLTQLKATNTAIKLLTVPTALGPSGTPINAASFTQIEVEADKLLQLLSQILLE